MSTSCHKNNFDKLLKKRKQFVRIEESILDITMALANKWKGGKNQNGRK